MIIDNLIKILFNSHESLAREILQNQQGGY